MKERNIRYNPEIFKNNLEKFVEFLYNIPESGLAIHGTSAERAKQIEQAGTFDATQSDAEDADIAENYAFLFSAEERQRLIDVYVDGDETTALELAKAYIEKARASMIKALEYGSGTGEHIRLQDWFENPNRRMEQLPVALLFKGPEKYKINHYTMNAGAEKVELHYKDREDLVQPFNSVYFPTIESFEPEMVIGFTEEEVQPLLEKAPQEAAAELFRIGVNKITRGLRKKYLGINS